VTDWGATVGIIANPASGKDIRRLIAHGSSFDNNEKINIVRRALLGLDAAGVDRVLYLPDLYAIVERAADPIQIRLRLEPLPMPVLGEASDSTEAAQRMRDLGAAALITLGGDGTNRVVAKGCGDVPLVPISTGTNNVFPTMVEGTLAGLAAGLVATGVSRNQPDGARVIRRYPRLNVLIDGEDRDHALIDVVTSRHAWVGSRALWNPEHLRDVVLSRVVPAAIGMASLGGLLFPEACDGCSGAHITVGTPDQPRSVLAPLAPGLMRQVPIERATLIESGATVTLSPGPCVVALDGEREFEVLDPGSEIAVRFSPNGPRVVDIGAAIQAAAASHFFTAETPSAPS
jgi:hypothetical protein